MNLGMIVRKIEEWAIDKNLHNANPAKQVLKLGEEYGELCSGMVKQREEVIRDSVGDMFVVMVILSLQLGIDLEECVNLVYEEIKDRKGKLVNGIFVKESDL